MHDGYESVDSVWITPSNAIDQEKEGKRTIIFPTLRNMRNLARLPQLVMRLQVQTRGGNTGAARRTEKRDDGNYLCIPPEAIMQSAKRKCQTDSLNRDT